MNVSRVYLPKIFILEVNLHQYLIVSAEDELSFNNKGSIFWWIFQLIMESSGQLFYRFL